MIGKKMSDAMNVQIKNELESYYIYLSMVAYFHSLNLDGMAHWMRAQAHEEMIHAMKFFDHVINRGGTVVLPNLKQLKTIWNSPAEAWQDAYVHEQFISSTIHNLIKIARKEGDFAAEPLLNWFANEQIEEEANAEKVAKQIALVADSKEGLFLLDRELGTRLFPPGSPLDPAAYNVAT